MTGLQIGELNLNHLRLLDAVARLGNVSEAAEQIGLTQSAASHALERLRRELQDPIFVRTAEGMSPTPYGSQLAARIRDALETLSVGLAPRSEFVPVSSKRTFNVFMSSVGQMLYLPRLAERLSHEAPGVTLRVLPVPSKGPGVMLETGEVDLAVGTYTRLIAGCRQKRLFREHHVCVARKAHPAFEHGMTKEAFHKVPHALAEPTGYVHELLDRWLARQKMRRIVRLHMPYFLALPVVIARTDLLGIMASRLAKTYAEMLPLKIMPLPTKLPAYDIKLFWHERFHNDPANRWLREVFVELFSDSSV